MGADQKCMSDSLKPDSQTIWKAMISAGSLRRACQVDNCGISGSGENIDWVLRPSTNYIRAADNQLIGTTSTAGIFVFNTLNPFGTGSDPVWTGLESAPRWTPNTFLNCNSWTEGSTGEGQIGSPASNSVFAISNGPWTCNSAARLYCVEQ